MTAVAVLDPPPWVPPRRALALWPLGLLAALLLAVGAWLWVALHPAVEQGSLSQPRGLEAATDGFEQTRYVAPPEGGELLVSLRNAGRLPLTVSAVPQEEGVAFLRVLGLRTVVDGATAGRGPWREAVRVGPGDEATLLLRAGVLPPYCAPYAPGSSATAVELPVRVRSLGVPSVQRLPLPLPVTVTGASPACRGEG